MKGMKMESTWRTIQVFISSQAAGIFEVEVNTDTKNIRCSCPVYIKSTTCKHTNFIKQKMRFNNGHYSVQIPTDISENLVIEASETPKAFRDFVLKYAKIEVL